MALQAGLQSGLRRPSPRQRGQCQRPDHGGTELAAATMLERLDQLRDPEQRYATVAEVVREVALINYEASRRSFEWQTFLSLSAAAVSDPEVREAVAQRLGQEGDFVEPLVPFYEDMALLLGLRFRPDVDPGLFTALGSSLLEGQMLRAISTPDTVVRPFTFDAGGGPAEWTMPALGFFGLIRGLTEPEPDYDPDRALEIYNQRQSARAENGD